MKNDDADEHLLAGIDLRAWRVPPPSPAARPPILVRALAPAPAKRRRVGWLIAGLALANAALIAIVVIIVRPTDAQPSVSAPAGGGSLDAQVQAVVRRLELERLELERRLAEIKELQATIEELKARLREAEDAARRNRTIAKDPKDPKDPKRVTPPTPPVPAPAPDPARVPPPDDTTATEDQGCDEVSCVLQNYPGNCCAKYRKPAQRGTFTKLPELASVKTSVMACRSESTAKGIVKVSVQVADIGLVSRATIKATPDAALGRCVEKAMKRAVFERTANGGSFTYPFVF